jgi:hypothetical protein
MSSFIMRFRPVAITTVALLLAVSQNAEAAIKSGTTCKTLGKSVNSNGKTFICTKSAGKKIYKAVAKAATKPAAKPADPQPVKTEEAKDSYSGLSGDISLRSYELLTSYLSKQPPLSGSSVFMELSPLASEQLSQSTLLDMEQGFRFWQAFTPASTKIHMIFADREDLKWFEAKMNQIQSGNEKWLPRILNLASEDKEAAYAGANGRDSQGNALFFYLPGKFTKADSPGWLGVGPHEWTHFAQIVMTGDSDKTPCWFKEGQATYYGNAISSGDKSKWASMWRQQLGTLNSDFPDFKRFSETQLLQWFKAHELNMPNNVCGPDGAFMIGGMATEYLVGTIGIEGINKFMLQIGKGKDWKSAFVEATGKSYEEEMDAIVKFVIQQREWAKIS